MRALAAAATVVLTLAVVVSAIEPFGEVMAEVREMTCCMDVSMEEPYKGRVRGYTHEYEWFPPRYTCIFSLRGGGTLRVEREASGADAFGTVLSLAVIWYAVMLLGVPLRRLAPRLRPFG